MESHTKSSDNNPEGAIIFPLAHQDRVGAIIRPLFTAIVANFTYYALVSPVLHLLAKIMELQKVGLSNELFLVHYVITHEDIVELEIPT
ncbi:jg27534 [Pararge aegeria aegeria]|uniref:Jg27534 protein n=1 Tax=Pararge aegeria aegeria TaxID=348720 RepID=A0A8S4SDX5_9NEOP|nr:jg27534 [Pararge aegeria aegeria]